MINQCYKTFYQATLLVLLLNYCSLLSLSLQTIVKIEELSTQGTSCVDFFMFCYGHMTLKVCMRLFNDQPGIPPCH